MRGVGWLTVKRRLDDFFDLFRWNRRFPSTTRTHFVQTWNAFGRKTATPFQSRRTRHSDLCGYRIEGNSIRAPQNKLSTLNNSDRCCVRLNQLLKLRTNVVGERQNNGLLGHT